MKKFFTLIACALVAGSAFAQQAGQDGWEASDTEGYVKKECITNGNIAWNMKCSEGDFSQYPAGKLTNFVANDWENDVQIGDKATARVTVDPDDADAFADAVDAGSGFNALNYCIVVGSNNNPSQAWDAQFFITVGEENAFQQGDKVTLTMKVKAASAGTPAVEGVKWTQEEIDAAEEGDPAFGKTTDDWKVEPVAATTVKASTQQHLAPGAYKHYAAVGDITFTEDWEEFTNTFTVDGNGATSYTIALNLSEYKTANLYYFDDISVVIEREEELTEDVELYDKSIPEGWSDLIVNGDFEDAEGGVANFVAHDYVTFDGEKQEFVPTRVIADPNEANNNKCIVVTTDANPKQEYDSQLFITVPEAQHFNEGDVIRLRMRVKADVAQTAGTQCHAAPGSYIFYQCAGDVTFKKVWTNFDSGEITVTKQMMQSGSNPGPFRTIALNLSKVAAGNNIYFDDVQLLIKEPEDPTIGLRSDLSIAITKGSAASDFMKTEDSYKAVVDAVDEGQLVLDNTDATAEELQAATKAINDAFAGLTYVDGYTPVTAAMFKLYNSVDEPGDGVATGCAFNLYDSVDMPYGDGNVGEKNWADLSSYDELVIVKSGDTYPRILMNRLEAGGQQAATQEDSKMLDINDNAGNSWSADKYQTIVDDNVFIINLKAIVEDYGFARLHSIKKQGWAAGVTVTDLIVGKGTTTEIGSFVAEKAAPKAIFNVAGQQIKSLQKGLNIVNGAKVYVK